MLADYYIHDLSPFLVKFGDGHGIRWYGLAYVAGFFGAFLLLHWLAGKKRAELRQPLVSDFIVMVALFGVLLGGRLGYMLLYNTAELLTDPLSFFKILGGGMSSHGGFLGVALFAWWYARRHKLSWCGLGDDIAVAAPIGIFFGRMANFVNGELWGRKTDVPWAVKFPNEIPVGEDRFGNTGYLWGFFNTDDPSVTSGELSQIPFGPAHEIMPMVHADPSTLEIMHRALAPRHPSQIYEAVLEGLLPLLIILFLRLKFRLGKGMLVGGFFVFYAVMRIIVENYREPDAGVSFILGLTRGQFYSTFMIAAGIAFLVYGWKTRGRVNEDGEAETGKG